MTPASPSPHPFFLEGSKGRLFAVHFAAGTTTRGAFLYLPPFAEEMNRSRHAVAEQARRLAKAGYDTLVLDPYGTGDSEGDLKDARWSTWREDALAGVQWLSERTGLPPVVWGLRLGALLAVDVAAHSGGSVSRLMLWQPVTDGKQHLTQHLRLRVAGLMDRGLPPETTEGIRAKFVSGESVEVAGYEIPGALAADLDDLRMMGLPLPAGTQIDWFENVGAPGGPIPPGASRVADAISRSGIEVRVHPFVSPPIWNLHERDDPSGLLDATSAIVVH